MTTRTIVDLIDARHVHHAYRLKREASEPELVQEAPVLEQAQTYGSVLRDADGLFRHWYLTTRYLTKVEVGMPDLDKHLYCEYYATSRDGIHWEKPQLPGIPQHASLIDKHPLEPNAFMASGQKDSQGMELCGLSGPEGFSVIDATVTPHPHARGRFTAMYLSSLGEGLTDGYPSGPTGGLCFAWSDDGVNWTAYAENPMIKGWMDSNNCFFYDEKIGKYVIYGRPNVFSKLGSELSNRIVARAESEDLIHWSPYQAVLDTDDRDADPYYFFDETKRRQYWLEHYKVKNMKVRKAGTHRGRNRQFYGIAVYPYLDLYLGLVQMYDIVSGEMWLELCHSYDGLQWNREAVPTPFMAPRKGHWDSAMVSSAAASPPVQVGDDLFFYYSGSSENHHQVGIQGATVCSIGLRKLKRNRYVGYRAGEHEGELVTIPIAVPARILLNCRVFAGGEIRVELFGARNEPLLGFELDNSVAVHEGDYLAHEVVFSQGRTLAEIPLAEIRLRIRYRRAVVYGWECETR